MCHGRNGTSSHPNPAKVLGVPGYRRKRYIHSGRSVWNEHRRKKDHQADVRTHKQFDNDSYGVLNTCALCCEMRMCWEDMKLSLTVIQQTAEAAESEAPSHACQKRRSLLLHLIHNFYFTHFKSGTMLTPTHPSWFYSHTLSSAFTFYYWSDTKSVFPVRFSHLCICSPFLFSHLSQSFIIHISRAKNYKFHFFPIEQKLTCLHIHDLQRIIFI